MLIKDLKQISEKLYQAALDNQEAWSNKRNEDASLTFSDKSFCWWSSPQGNLFWCAVYSKDFDTARRIDKENGWGLFEEENPKFEIGEHARIFRHRDVTSQRTAIFNDKVYSRNDAREWAISSQWSLKTAQCFIDLGVWIEVTDRPEEAASDEDVLENLSIIRDGLPSDYVPPQEPRKALSFLYNDKQREEAQGYWDRIHRVRHK